MLYFKFQSDSINTFPYIKDAINFINFKFQSDSINTLLERETVERTISFKFQSDSINTSAVALADAMIDTL